MVSWVLEVDRQVPAALLLHETTLKPIQGVSPDMTNEVPMASSHCYGSENQA